MRLQEVVAQSFFSLKLYRLLRPDGNFPLLLHTSLFIFSNSLEIAYLPSIYESGIYSHRGNTKLHFNCLEKTIQIQSLVRSLEEIS